MNHQDRLRLEEAVRSGASSELNAFLIGNPPAAGRTVLVNVVIRTGVPLSAEGRAAVVESLSEVSDSFPGNQYQLQFDVDPALGTNSRIYCEPVVRSQQAERPRQEPRQAPAAAERLLSVGFGTLRFEYVVSAGNRWSPLGRPNDDSGHDGFVLPRSMLAVPHGDLLTVRLSGGDLVMRRTAERPDITVLVNGDLLRKGGRLVPARGQITYQDRAGSPVTLEYALTEWVPAAPSAPGLPRTGDGAPHLVWLKASSRTDLLRILPPPARHPRVRDFPVPSDTPDRPRRLEVQVVYTTGAWHDAVAPQWHVKIYRCATPQHANQLRRYLRTQAALIDQANAACGWSPQSPPWAIAPVIVIPEGSGYRAGDDQTRFTVTPREINDDPENRLSAWFGVPDQPQPNCFVIVVSPLLKTVGWAHSLDLGGAPAVSQLSALRTLAVGLDGCHGQDVTHCDIKPANVCRYRADDDSTGYVLIDGDAVARVRGRLGDLRLTETWAAPEILASFRSRGTPSSAVNLREHDRFGFALIVLTAVAGIDRTMGLVEQDEHGARLIDDPELAVRTISGYWPRWPELAAELAAPFQRNALVGESWRAESWLKRLEALREPLPVDEGDGGSPPQQPTGRHGRHVAAVHERVTSHPLGQSTLLDELVKEIAAEQLVVARKAYWRTVGFGLLAVLFSLVVLAGVAIGSSS
ncbi:hypothetical protein ACWGE0_43780 [Lentzea sp. NPDC054927]